MASRLDPVLPPLWQRPSLEALLEALHGLELRPPVWNERRLRRRPSSSSSSSEEDEKQQQQEEAEHGRLAGRRRAEEVTGYLSSLVKSPLAWLVSDEARERVWELASRRTAERCGRAALGDVVRRWPLADALELVIREPALTGDAALGLKTWASSYVLARHLPRLAATALFGLFDESLGRAPPPVLELGAGTGLLGLAAAALWRVPVALSDLPRIVPNLRHNVEANAALVRARGGEAVAGPLTWGAAVCAADEGAAADAASGDDDEGVAVTAAAADDAADDAAEQLVDQALFGAPFQFKIVLAADPLYDDDHPGLLAAAIGRHLALGPDARAVVMVPRRDAATGRLLDAFRRAMGELEPPLLCAAEDELAGQDDWVDDDAAGAVRCWLGVFSRGGTPASFC